MENCNCYFIAEKDFIENQRTDFVAGLNNTSLMVAIKSSHKKLVDRNILCTALITQLCTQIKEDNLTILNAELLVKIQDFQVPLAYSIFLPLLQKQVAEQAFVTKATDTSIPVSEKGLQLSVKFWIEESQSYVKDILDFLKENQSENVLYKDCLNTCKDVSNNSDSVLWL